MQKIRTLALGLATVFVLVAGASLFGIGVNLPQMAWADSGLEYRTVFVPATTTAADGESGPVRIDAEDFADDIGASLNRLVSEGFEIVEVETIIRGRLDTGLARDGAWGGGYSTTQGAVIIAARPF